MVFSFIMKKLALILLNTLQQGYEVLKRIGIAIENRNRNDIRHLSRYWLFPKYSKKIV